MLLPMTTLHVDITINDEAAFRASFADHSDIRQKAGVEAERVHQVAGDPRRLQIELDFGAADQAEAFLGYLRERIWKDNPVLVGTPEARVLEPLGT
jgi:hypothetical protein